MGLSPVAPNCTICVPAEVLTSQDEPFTGGRSPDRDVGFAVSRVVALDGAVGAVPEREHDNAGRRTPYPPLSVRWTIDRNICTPAAVVIRRDWNVSVRTELFDGGSAGRSLHEPHSACSSKYCRVGFSVGVVIRRYRDVAGRAK